MDSNFVHNQIEGRNSINLGPISKEILLQQAESEYCNGNILQSIFYQTFALYQNSQERFNLTTDKSGAPRTNNKAPSENVDSLIEQMNPIEFAQFKKNPLLQFAYKSLKKEATNKNADWSNGKSDNVTSCNFLSNTTDPMEGIARIQEICRQLPNEWTIIQMCKGPRVDNSYLVFPKIHESDSVIYLTLMKHARSNEYGKPVSLRFARPQQKHVFQSFANIINRFKRCVEVVGNTHEEKKRYWQMLGELNIFIANACADFKNFLYPWTFLFTGIPYSRELCQASLERWSKIDKFCDKHKWNDDARVLLSLLASNLYVVSIAQIVSICELLTDNQEQRSLASEMLTKMLNESNFAFEDINKNRHYPCILVIDERLDHFFWEEINVHQEFTRINSLQCLWRLYRHHKTNIRQGYLNVNITDGCCLINPDQNLPKMESRLRTFFEYWLPHWNAVIGQRPPQVELLNNLCRSCYVYAGHGSGLQYINGRNLTKREINCVVFLFGCDSSRLHSNGLYSELLGPHLYYQAAMCPALVGTLMPGLDSNMDKIATEILSRWIVPKSEEVLPWNKIDENEWVKKFIIKPGHESTTTMANTPNYNNGSLCAVLARIHQRTRETKLYNTAPYVCRGLPVWNCNAESLPSS